jgi:hypothetical protein
VVTPTWSGDRERGRRIVSEIESFSTPIFSKVGPMAAAEAQIAAARLGLGMTTLSCFVGDADLLLVRDVSARGDYLWLDTGEFQNVNRER